jgi:GrpB-like predicted nucleotidyltransferase (UPF0157 family)
MNKQTVESIVRNQDDEMTIQHMNDDRAEIEQLKQKNDLLRQHLYAWSERYADLKIQSDWAHDNMQEQLAHAKADGIREAMQYATSNHTKGVRAALRKYIELLEGKG